VVIMAGYTAGTHEPASTNGAVDLAIDANDDGLAEPWASRKAEVIATHDGIVTIHLRNWAAGNHVMIEGSEGWRSEYSHLESIDVRTGDRVKSGQRIGTIGATGQAGGPHLDYKVWHDGKNTDPTQFLKCD
jgi:murein DD-endopeptidase MepM/ murein hydrolase activator NlpD